MSKQPTGKDLEQRVKELEQESGKRQQAEKALRVSEEKLRTVLHTSPFPIAVTDTNDENIIFWSRSAKKMFGHNPKIVSEWYELAYPDPDYRQAVINRWKPLLKKAQKTKTTINTGEYQINCQDGSIRTCELYITFLQDLLIVTFNDISERKKAEAVLVRAKHLYYTTIDSMSDAVHVMDLDYRILLHNKKLEKWNLLLGVNNDVDGKVLFEIYPFIPDHAVSEYDQVIKEKKVIITEDSVDIDGHIIETETLKIPVFENGNVIRIITIMRDVSERKQTIEEIRKSEELYRLINDSSKDSIYSYDRESRFTRANNHLRETLELPANEIIGKTHSELGFPEVLVSEWAEMHRYVFENGNTVRSETTAPVPDGNIHNYEVILNPLHDNNGNIIGISGTTRDITESIEASKALRDSENKYRLLVENMKDMVSIHDPDGIYKYLSPSVTNILGYDEEELLGKNPYDLFYPDDRNHIEVDSHEPALRKKEIDYIEYRMKTKSGKYKWLESSTKPILDAEDNVVSLQVITRDINERKRLESQALQAQRMESIGLLAGGIAHDFNNILSGIFGYIEMALEETSEEIVSTYLTHSVSSLDRARALTRQLLTFAKGGAPIIEVENLFPFVQETVQFALSGSSVLNSFQVQKNLWPCKFDKNQISQVVDNLTINALQSMPNGGTIVVSARNVSISEGEHLSLASGSYVKLSITDQGIGIPKESLPLIFDPYFSTKTKGHGLGLATCYSIIKRHEGYLEVESELGKGSTFHLYLPASTESISTGDGKSTKRHTGSGTFLIMEDEKIISTVVKKKLETFGYTVVVKGNGEDAIDYFSEEIKAGRKLSGMIFDLTIPGGMGGKEAIKVIREICRDTPVFVSSGYSEDQIIAKPEEFGFTASICKPFTITELSELLENHMKKHI